MSNLLIKEYFAKSFVMKIYYKKLIVYYFHYSLFSYNFEKFMKD